MRQGQLFSDKEAAKMERGNAKKNDLIELPFTKKLQYGISKDGFVIGGLHWCLEGKKYNYCFIFDHSNGHAHQRHDRFDIKRMNKHYGGKQPMMRDSVIEVKRHLGSYQRDNKLRLSYVQSMSLVASVHASLCYMSDAKRKEKNIIKLGNKGGWFKYRWVAKGLLRD